MCHTKNCYQICINKSFLIPKNLLKQIKKIITELSINAKTGRPQINSERAINGIYYLLRTGIHWKALPRCFGSTSAIHRYFTKLVSLDFFKKLWFHELQEYDRKHGLKLQKQAMDCAHRKSPLGREKSGKSPVDRRKLGSKLSILSEEKGVIIGLAMGSSNQHDSTLFIETLKSVPQFLNQPCYKVMNLDSAYDSVFVKTALFNWYYVPKIAPNQRRNKIPPKNPLGYSRWFIEPVHAWINKFRAIFTRYSKAANNYLAYAQFAAAIIIFKKI